LSARFCHKPFALRTRKFFAESTGRNCISGARSARAYS
jgi:hypothetical protein